jgi:O-antigen/teichoic acid export membrane protein
VQVVAVVVSYVATLAFYVVLARELGEDGFGDFNFALSIALLVSIAALGTDYAIMQEVARDRERVHHVFWNSVAIRTSIAVFGVALAVGFTAARGYSVEIIAATAILAVSSAINVLAQAIQAALRGVEDMAPIAASWVIGRFFIAAVGSVAVWLGAGLTDIALVYVAGSLIGLVYCAMVLVRRHVTPRLAISWTRSRSLIGKGIPLAIGNLLVLVLSRIDVVILSGLKGNAAVGIYGAAYRLFESSAFFSTIFGLSAYPALSRLTADTRPTIGQAYEKGSKALVLFLLPAGVALVLFADPVIAVLYGSEYADSASVLSLLAIAIPLWALLVFTMFVLAAGQRQRAISWALALGVATNIGLNFALIPPYSADGAAAAMTISLAITDVILIAVAVRTTGDVRLTRIWAAPLAGSMAFLAVVLPWGTELTPAMIGTLVCLGVMVLIERRFFRGDLGFILRAVRGGLGHGGAAESAPSVGAAGSP